MKPLVALIGLCGALTLPLPIVSQNGGPGCEDCSVLDECIPVRVGWQECDISLHCINLPGPHDTTWEYCYPVCNFSDPCDPSGDPIGGPV